MIDQLFKIATEFRFEIGHAMVGTQALQGQVEKLSGAVDNTLLSFQKLGIGFASSMGVTGMLGILQTSLSAFEDFRYSQLNFINMFSANRDKFIGPLDTFQEKASVASLILKDMAKTAREWALPQKEFIHMTEAIAPMLIPEGGAGTNLKGATDLSRKLLKSAPAMNINASESVFQMQSIIGGFANANQTLFTRLTADTDAMRAFAGQTEKFNKLAPDKRLNILNTALDQFSKDMDVLSGRTQLVSTQIQVIKDLFHGVDSVLLPLGQMLNKFGSDILPQLVIAINTHGRKIIENFVAFIKPMATSVENLIIAALQLKEISNDLKKSGQTLGMLGIISLVGGFATLFKVLKWIATPVIAAATALFGFISKIGIFTVLWKGLLFVLTKLTLPLTIIFGLFQLLSRAKAIAKVEDLKQMPAIMARFSDVAARSKTAFNKILWPFTTLFDIIARAISPIFEKSILLRGALWVLEAFTKGLEDIANFFVSFYGVIVGIGTSYIALIQSIKALDFTNIGKNMSEAFMFGYEETVKSFNSDFASAEAPVVHNVQNFHGGIKIENKFKENQEPDRIAFTMIEQLSKAGRNKTQAAGMTLKPANSYVG